MKFDLDKFLSTQVERAKGNYNVEYADTVEQVIDSLLKYLYEKHDCGFKMVGYKVGGFAEVVDYFYYKDIFLKHLNQFLKYKKEKELRVIIYPVFPDEDMNDEIYINLVIDQNFINYSTAEGKYYSYKLI